MTVRRQTTAKTHAPDGSLTMSELDRRYQTICDAASLTVRCELPGCDWSYDGPAAEAIQQAAAHRERAHPEVAKRATKKRRRPAAGPVKEVPMLKEASRDEIPTRAARESALEAIRAFIYEHGRPPTLADLDRPDNNLPGWAVVRDLFPSFDAALAAAGPLFAMEPDANQPPPAQADDAPAADDAAETAILSAATTIIDGTPASLEQTLAQVDEQMRAEHDLATLHARRAEALRIVSQALGALRDLHEKAS